MTAPPLAFRWDGESFRPLRPKDADREFVIGQVYWLEEAAERSRLSHDHQFAWLAEAWRQLPESLAELYPTPEHLRKRALIDAGFYRETIVDAGSRAAALRVAAYARAADEFALVIARGALVVVRKARSQAMHGHDRMTKDEFQASKTAIMDVVARLIGVDAGELGRTAA